MNLPNDIDQECKGICEAINRIGGSTRTTCSCSGHGRTPFRVFFMTRSFRALAEIAYAAEA